MKGCCATRIQIGQPCWRIMSSPPSRLTLINIAARVGCEDCTANVGGRERGGACISFVSFGIVEDDEARSVEKGKRGNRRGTTPQVKMTPRRKATTQDCSNADALMVWKLRQERTCNSRNLACINLLKDTQSAEFGVEGFTYLRIRSAASQPAVARAQLDSLNFDQSEASILVSIGLFYMKNLKTTALTAYMNVALLASIPSISPLAFSLLISCNFA